MKKSEFVKRSLIGLCPFVTVQELISGKWTILILRELFDGAKRYKQLHKRLDITQATLTKQLRFLTYEGLVDRKIFAEVPPRVEYSLTELGESFQAVLASVDAWEKIFAQDNSLIAVPKLISGKWSVLILRELYEGTKRFNQLKRKLDITHATLTKQLRFLEREGLVSRKIFAEVPPHVEYSLTELGKTFQPVLDSIETWGENFIAYLNQRN